MSVTGVKPRCLSPGRVPPGSCRRMFLLLFQFLEPPRPVLVLVGLLHLPSQQWPVGLPDIALLFHLRLPCDPVRPPISQDPAPSQGRLMSDLHATCSPNLPLPCNKAYPQVLGVGSRCHREAMVLPTMLASLVLTLITCEVRPWRHALRGPF